MGITQTNAVQMFDNVIIFSSCCITVHAVIVDSTVSIVNHSSGKSFVVNSVIGTFSEIRISGNYLAFGGAPRPLS